MGNCAPKPKSQSGPRPPNPSASPTIRLYGSESCLTSSRLRLALLYKSVPYQFIPRDSPLLGRPFLQCGPDTLVGGDYTLLRELDSRFPCPRVAADALAKIGKSRWPAPAGTEADEVALVAALQHRSLERHVEDLGRWAEEMAAGGRGRGDSARMGRSYGLLVELVMEHAQMEERLLFPALEVAADQAVCKVANEEHARDLPLINGIKEDIKSTVVMEAGTPFHQEALLNLSSRFKTLEEHFKEHFQEEEKKLFPLLEMTIKSQMSLRAQVEQEENDPLSSLSWTEQLMSIMEATHSPRLFPFLVAGLRPEEAMQYLALVCRHMQDQRQLLSMLRSLIAYLETKDMSPLECL
ncbi:uncharacterized protein LOC121997020 [Zingiber officinale]|uniref:Hemerythrin-like domain-containing protein n=1 Tax=Zingiber officinale TaxID=94328 RepID=A0A8J5G4V9_ZINOF|nr:uncharacterized protein LOC121997020 [Zingiber officinale]KAG6500445.1 hypothetical protein ZIOFF_040290 [Zingiber officinale]